MDINIKLESFEGPMDLLYSLIIKNKIDIYDIPIVELTDQYLEYVDYMQRENMDSISEFILMAATLIEIKSKCCCLRKLMKTTKKLTLEKNW